MLVSTRDRWVGLGIELENPYRKNEAANKRSPENLFQPLELSIESWRVIV